jgi:hypothetical protein
MKEPPYWWPDTKSVIATIIVISVIAIAFTLIFKPDAANSQLLQVLVGGLMSVGLSTVVSYYFGSSQESHAKGETIAQIATGKASGSMPTPPAPPPAGPPAS